MQELKLKFLIKGKRSNKLDAALNNNSFTEEDTVSEEDEAADCKENDQKAKSKVCQVFVVLFFKNMSIYFLQQNWAAVLSSFLEIKNQTCQRALKHCHLLQECPF